jgi:hypothetical protein
MDRDRRQPPERLVCPYESANAEGALSAHRICRWLAKDIASLRKKIDKADNDEKELRRCEAVLARTLRLHGNQTERIGNISTRLRLTQRAQYRRADAAAVGAENAPYPKPWDWRS